MSAGFWRRLLLDPFTDGHPAPQRASGIEFPHVPGGHWEVASTRDGGSMLCLWVKRWGALDGKDLYAAFPGSWDAAAIAALIPTVLKELEAAQNARARSRSADAARREAAQHHSQHLGMPVTPYRELR